ncbi:MAG TPA: hypothetical protein DCP02_01160 [Actinobacteria bacterium]|nr:hypothetical protein [Actinomycetota bacterium]
MTGNDIDKFKLISDGSITSVPGFQAGSAHCGLKNSKEKTDICIIYTPTGSVCSGIFTTNSFQAAPVIINRESLENNNKIKAIIVNSGIANACTGKKGMENALNTMKMVESSVPGVKKNEVLISSTGIIGKQLPMDKIENGIRDCTANLSIDGGNEAARAIMTTDLAEKKIAVSIAFENGKKIIIGGIAKGSGMIEPNMATMLAFIGTDAKIEKKLLDKILKKGNESSFNSISVDGCQSTNDMVLIMANGESGIKVKDEDDKTFKILSEGIFFVMKELAKKIVMDGEGATKFIEIAVRGAVNNEQAKKAARKIANSNLFKTAMFGQDLNWGRINSAIGSSDCEFDPDDVDIYLGDAKIVENGAGIEVDKALSEKSLKKRNLNFRVDLKNGSGNWTVWTSDLSFDYIKINALYHN